MRAPSPSLPTAVLTFVITIGSAPASLACPVMPDDSRELSIEIAPDLKPQIYTAYYKDYSAEPGPGRCSAWIEIPLSGFPSSRLATRPADVAGLLTEVVAEWGVENCSVHVQYANDTAEEFAEHELCLIEDFRFDEDAYWSSSSERYCWEPLPTDSDEEAIRQDEVEVLLDELEIMAETNDTMESEIEESA